MTTAAANYTDEMTASLVKEYTNSPTAETVEALAVKFGKTAASIRMKLVREGVYQAKAKPAAGGRVKKSDLVNQIEELLNLPGELESLEKVTVDALKAIIAGLQK